MQCIHLFPFPPSYRTIHTHFINIFTSPSVEINCSVFLSGEKWTKCFERSSFTLFCEWRWNGCVFSPENGWTFRVSDAYRTIFDNCNILAPIPTETSFGFSHLMMSQLKFSAFFKLHRSDEGHLIQYRTLLSMESSVASTFEFGCCNYLEFRWHESLLKLMVVIVKVFFLIDPYFSFIIMLCGLV